MSDIEMLEKAIKEKKETHILLNMMRIIDDLTSICGDYSLDAINKIVKDNDFSENNTVLDSMNITYDKKKLKDLRKTLSNTQSQLLLFIQIQHKLFRALSEKNKALSKEIDFDKLRAKLTDKFKSKNNVKDNFQGIS